MSSVYQFSTCREYLRAAFEGAKSSSPRLSLETYADRVGLGRSTLRMILSGKRKLSLAQALIFAKTQKLSTSESEYLQVLVLRDKSKIRAEQNFYSKKAGELKKNAKLRSFPLAAKGLLVDPYVLPLLVYLTDFRSSKTKDSARSSFEISRTEIEGIARRFHVEPSRFEGALETLAKLDIVKNRDPGSEVHYVFSHIAQLMSQQAYVKDWLKESARRIEIDYQNPEALFQVSSITLTRKKLPELIRDLKSVVEKYVSMPVDPQGDNTIAQLGIQMFPILDADLEGKS